MPRRTGREATAAATAAVQWAAAERHAADPAKLAKAVRTVIAGAPRLTAEQVATIRALLPPVRPAVDIATDEPQPAA